MHPIRWSNWAFHPLAAGREYLPARKTAINRTSQAHQGIRSRVPRLASKEISKSAPATHIGIIRVAPIMWPRVDILELIHRRPHHRGRVSCRRLQLDLRLFFRKDKVQKTPPASTPFRAERTDQTYLIAAGWRLTERTSGNSNRLRPAHARLCSSAHAGTVARPGRKQVH